MIFGKPRQFLLIAALTLLLSLLAAPVAAQTPCDSNEGRLADLHTRQQLKDFVHCAAEHLEAVGWEQAIQDFETEAWRDGPVYLFAGDGEGKVIFIAGLDVPPGTDFLDMQDSEGTFHTHQQLRLMRDFGGGFVYYRFTNPVSGQEEPKVAYNTRVDHEGQPAFLGSGLYPQDTHATCSPEIVRASLVYSERELERFVSCAEHHLRQRGLQAIHDFNTDPRWISGPTYLALLDLDDLRMLVNAGQPELVGQDLSEDADPDGVRISQEGKRVLGSHDDGYIYFSTINPETDAVERKSTYLRRVLLDGRAYMLAAGLYESQMQP